jgi:hypothetical protein
MLKLEDGKMEGESIVVCRSPAGCVSWKRIDVVHWPLGKRVAVVPCFGAEAKSKRPFKAFMRSRIVRRPIFDERPLRVPAGGSRSGLLGRFHWTFAAH